MRIVNFSIFTMAAAISVATPSLAVNTTFAQFTQQSSDRVVNYTNSGTFNAMSVVDAPTNFVINAFGPLGIYSTLLNIQATSSAFITNTGPQFEQVGWSGFYSFTNGTTNYLTVNFTNAITDIGGRGGAGSMFATSLLGATIHYTSDVIDVSQIAASDFALAFSGVTPPYGIDPNGFGTPFTSNIAGTFAGEVPEPSQWAMLLIGFGLSGLAMRKRRTNLASVAA